MKRVRRTREQIQEEGVSKDICITRTLKVNDYTSKLLKKNNVDVSQLKNGGDVTEVLAIYFVRRNLIEFRIKGQTETVMETITSPEIEAKFGAGAKLTVPKEVEKDVVIGTIKIKDRNESKNYGFPVYPRPKLDAQERKLRRA